MDQLTGGVRLKVCWSAKLPPLFVHDSASWLELGWASWTGGTGITETQAENSDVLLVASVAVAVTTQPDEMVAGKYA